MLLDGVTLMVAGCFVAALAGVLLVGSWLQSRSTPALLWWGAGHFVNAVGVALLTLGLAVLAPPVIVAGAGIVVVSMLLYWTGTRVFVRRSPAPWIAAGCMAAFGAAAAGTLAYGARPSVAAMFVLTFILLALSCSDLWRARAERLPARWGLIAVFALHAVYIGAGALGFTAGNMTVEPAPSPFTWFGSVHFERLIFLIGSAVFMIGIAREREEVNSTSAARIDSLTGASNRGAFLARSERFVRRSQEDRTAVSLILFDLDHFKAINDTHGHASGDRVLRYFVETAGAMLRPADLLGRLGGEEFAAILPGAGVEAACVIADRVRRAFEIAPAAVGGPAVNATVSAGVATLRSGMSLEDLLEAADQALYRAKALGRNRVERALEIRLTIEESNVIRVA
jgi:diguanylate cyclase (GGDEF)-like protein